ncbi:conserved hypothetical protein [Cenarchaeum symbiosum A]|uniref:Uncharacterized protein n=1 Tax=Cenarchaeum symbiosum (strain A) TaxID=414004 RepID=A0RTS1_CENSY|nr:conserved hypothetical protein [Cenarchaeum symbiosum A]
MPFSIPALCRPHSIRQENSRAPQVEHEIQGPISRPRPPEDTKIGLPQAQDTEKARHGSNHRKGRDIRCKEVQLSPRGQAGQAVPPGIGGPPWRQVRLSAPGRAAPPGAHPVQGKAGPIRGGASRRHASTKRDPGRRDRRGL